jgi:two-component system chemotaxis response regulator CheB
LRPDIIAMDVRVPTAQGFNAVIEIMAETPTPILILADEAQTQQSGASLSALNAGALAVVARPSSGQDDALEGQRFIALVKAMAQVKVVRRWRDRPPPVQRSPRSAVKRNGSSPRVVAIAASTGGPAAVHQLLSELPPDFELPILAVQHIGVGFVEGMVTWLNGASALTVKVATHGERLTARTVYMAPDDRHLGVSDPSTVLLSRAEAIGGFRPSATFLYQSVANIFGASALHVILTGMGQDGVAGLRIAREFGGTIVAQDPKTSVVGGMPGEAVNAGLADFITPLSALAQNLSQIARS